MVKEPLQRYEEKGGGCASGALNTPLFDQVEQFSGGYVIEVMTGIRYLTDEKGNRVAVQIDLQKYARLWEEFEDALLAKERLKERRTTLADVERELLGAKKRK